MDIDEVFRTTSGEFGKYQILVYFSLAALHTCIGFHMIHLATVGAVPTFQCITVQEQFPINQCSHDREACNHVNYNVNVTEEEKFTSIVSEWDLVCTQSYRATLVQSLFMAGVLAGALSFGPLADRIGRQRSLALALVGLTVFSIVSSFAPTINVYTALRVATGFFCGGTILVSFVLATEVVGASRRAFCGLMISCMFAFGIMLFGLMSYLIRDWRHLSLASSLPFLSTVTFYWYIPESPRWLLARGQVAKAESVLALIGQRNGKPQRSLNSISLQIDTQGKTKAKTTHSVLDLVRYKSLRGRTVVMVYGWFVNSAVYYGLTMSAGSLGSNRYLSLSLSGAVEVPAYAASLFLVEKLGRRLTYCSCLIIGGVSCLCILLADNMGSATLTTSLAMLGKLTIAASFAVIYIYAAELYPTAVRSNAMSVCSMSARLGGIVSPIIVRLGDIYPSFQFILFGFLSLMAGIVSIRLPETLGQPMPETIQDVETSAARQTSTSPDGQYVTDPLKLKLLEEEINASE